MMSSLTTSTTTPERGNVPASSALSVGRQSKTERKGKSIRKGNRERKLRPTVSQPAELPALHFRLFVYINSLC